MSFQKYWHGFYILAHQMENIQNFLPIPINFVRNQLNCNFSALRLSELQHKSLNILQLTTVKLSIPSHLILDISNAHAPYDVKEIRLSIGLLFWLRLLSIT